MNIQNKHHNLTTKLAIFGTSGFSYETADVAIAAGYSKIVLIADNMLDMDFDRFEVVSEDYAVELHKEGYSFAIGIGEPKIRKKIYEKFPNYHYPNLIHPKATLGYLQDKLIEKSIGNIITAGVVITNNVEIGNFNIFNLNTTVGHDCIIKNYISVMPSVNVSGNVEINDEVFIGVGAVILQGKSAEDKLFIGRSAVIGASSLVTKNIDDYCTVVGVPAKVIKRDL